MNFGDFSPSPCALSFETDLSSFIQKHQLRRSCPGRRASSLLPPSLAFPPQPGPGPQTPPTHSPVDPEYLPRFPSAHPSWIINMLEILSLQDLTLVPSPIRKASSSSSPSALSGIRILDLSRVLAGPCFLPPSLLPPFSLASTSYPSSRSSPSSPSALPILPLTPSSPSIPPFPSVVARSSSPHLPESCFSSCIEPIPRLLILLGPWATQILGDLGAEVIKVCRFLQYQRSLSISHL